MSMSIIFKYKTKHKLHLHYPSIDCISTKYKEAIFNSHDLSVKKNFAHNRFFAYFAMRFSTIILTHAFRQ